MNYLNKKNMPSKITGKQLATYFKAKEEGLSANENYNVSVLGITTSLYKWIDVAIQNNYGMLGGKSTIRLKVLNDWLKSDSHVFDDHGNYRNYYGNKYPIA